MDLIKLLYAILFLFSILACKIEPEKIETEIPIKIGILAPNQGPRYCFLTDLHRGLDLAFTDAGNFSLIWENSDPLTAHGKTAIEKLIQKDKVLAIFGGDDLDVASNIAVAANKNKLIYFPALLTLPGVIAEGPYVFSTTPTCEQLAGTLVQFCKEELNGKSVSILYREDAYHHLLAKRLRDSLVRNDIKILIINNHLSPLDKDFLAQSDVVFLLTDHEWTLSSLEALRSEEYQKPVIGSIFSVRHPIDDQIKDEHFYYPRISIRENSRYFRNFSRDFQNFHQRITVQFPELFDDGPNHFEAQAFEAAQLLIGAIREVGTNPSDQRHYLLSNQFKSLTGALHFDESGTTHRKFEMVHHVNGRAEVIMK